MKNNFDSNFSVQDRVNLVPKYVLHFGPPPSSPPFPTCRNSGRKIDTLSPLSRYDKLTESRKSGKRISAGILFCNKKSNERKFQAR